MRVRLPAEADSGAQALATQAGAQPAGVERRPTFCRLCEAFCGLVATVADGKVVKIGPDRDNPHSQGHICVKGPAIADIANDPDRVLRPLRRVGAPGDFVEVGWDEALDDIAARLKRIRDAHGPDAIAEYFGNPGAFSTNTFMGAQWFLRRLGSWKFYTAGSQDANSRHLASYITYGVAFRNSIPDLPNNDFLIIVGANPLVSHGGLLTAPRMRHDLDAIAARGRIVVIDPRRSETAERYEHLPIRPDTDAWLLAAMLRVIIEEGLTDQAFLQKHVTGWEALSARIVRFPVAEAAARTGIAAETIRALARDFVAADRAALYGRVGICRGRFSTLANVLVDAINIAAGKFGQVGGSVFGAFPFGSGGELLQGYRLVETRLGPVPLVGGMAPAALLPEDILEPGDGQVRALLLIAGNPMLSAPGGAKLPKAFEALELFVSSDLYLNESNKHAHYVLPVPTFLEKADMPVLGVSHMPRPFLQYSPAVIPTMGQARDEFDVFAALSERMGLGPISPVAGASPLDLMDQALRSTSVSSPSLSDEPVSIATLAKRPHGVMLHAAPGYGGWQAHLGTEDRKFRFWHPILAGELDRFEAETAAPMQDGLRLFSRRQLKSLNSWMHNLDKLTRSQSPVLLIHPDDAAPRRIADGDLVLIASAHGGVEVRASVSDHVMPGAVCYPHGWGHDGGWRNANAQAGANINLLLGVGFSAMEPASGVSFIDGIPVEVSRVTDWSGPPSSSARRKIQRN